MATFWPMRLRHDSVRHRMTELKEKMVVEFRHMRNHAYEPLPASSWTSLREHPL